jgi:hypothetical protein
MPATAWGYLKVKKQKRAISPQRRRGFATQSKIILLFFQSLSGELAFQINVHLNKNSPRNNVISPCYTNKNKKSVSPQRMPATAWRPPRGEISELTNAFFLTPNRFSLCNSPRGGR